MENYTFYPGQKVVCVKSTPWAFIMTGEPTTGPNHGSILEVRSVERDALDIGLRFDGWDDPADLFNHRNFRPIDTLTEQVDRIEKEGCPVEHELEFA